MFQIIVRSMIIASFLICLLLSMPIIAFAYPGDLDSSFGTNGKVITDFGGNDDGVALAIEDDGEIVVAGYSDEDFALARYNSDGTLDSSFGTGGMVITDFGGNECTSSATVRESGLQIKPHSSPC